MSSCVASSNASKPVRSFMAAHHLKSCVSPERRSVARTRDLCPVGVFVVARCVGAAALLLGDVFHQRALEPVVLRVLERTGEAHGHARLPAALGRERVDQDAAHVGDFLGVSAGGAERNARRSRNVVPPSHSRRCSTKLRDVALIAALVQRAADEHRGIAVERGVRRDLGRVHDVDRCGRACARRRRCAGRSSRSVLRSFRRRSMPWP